MQEWIACVYAFVGCVAFCFIFEMRRWPFILCAAGIGTIAQATYLVLSGVNSSATRLLLATIVTAGLAEIFARILKTPATVLLIIGIIPLVPGSGVYYTMDALINGDIALFIQEGLATAADAGALAVGSSLGSAVTRILLVRRPPQR